MTRGQFAALQHWLEYCKPSTQKWWTEGGYYLDARGDYK